MNLILLLAAAAAKVVVDVVGSGPEYCGSAMLETSSWLHRQSPSLFWAYIDRLAEQTASPAELAEAAFHAKLVPGLAAPEHLQAAVKSRAWSHLAAVYTGLYRRVDDKVRPIDDACQSWVQVGSAACCSTAELEQALQGLLDGSLLGGRPAEALFEFDRFLSKDLTAFPVVVLWAHPHDLSWAPLHRALAKVALGGDITYLFRYLVKTAGCVLERDRIHLSGFGASFEVKQDDGAAAVGVGAERAQEIAAALGVRAPATLQLTTSMAADELIDMGVLATQTIIGAKRPLDAFHAVACNFPLAAPLIHGSAKLDRALADRFVQLQRRYHLFPQVDLIAVNGILVESGGLSLPGLRAFGERYAQLYGLLKDRLDAGTAAKVFRSGAAKSPPTFDVRSPAVLMLNDLERDPAYAAHPKALRSILRHTNSGFYELQRNLVTAVVCVDPRHPQTGRILASLAEGWLERQAPVRLGLLLTNSEADDATAVVIRAFLGVAKEHGSRTALAFLTRHLGDASEDVEQTYAALGKQLALPLARTVEELSDDHAVRSAYLETRALAAKVLLTPQPALFVNGRLVPVADFDASLAEAYRREIGDLQQMVFKQELTDDVADLYAHVLAARKAFTHRHPGLFKAEIQPRFLDVSRLSSTVLANLLDPERHVYPVAHPRGSPGTTTTLWLVVDAHRRHELDLLKETMRFLKKTQAKTRVRLLFTNPISRHAKDVLITYRELLKGKLDLEKYAEFIEKSTKVRNTTPEHLIKPGKSGTKSRDYEQSLEAFSFVQAVVLAAGLPPKYTDPLVFVNGRLAATLGPDDPKFTADHLELVVQHELARCTDALATLVGPPADAGELLLKATVFQLGALQSLQSVFGSGQNELRPFPPQVPDDFPSFTVGDPATALLSLQAIIDPLHAAAPRYAAIVQAVQQEAWFGCRTWLNPMVKLGAFPLPSFYRLAATGPLEFETEPGAGYAVSMDAPPAWDVVLDKSSAHPDSLAGAESSLITMQRRALIVEAKYELSADVQTLGGLNMVARDRRTDELLEQVPLMGDLNIAQFSRLTDRVFYLDVEPAAGAYFKAGATVSGAPTAQGRDLHYLAVEQTAPLPAGSLHLLSPPAKTTSKATVNVFSIASGAMYERLIRIMMVSATKKTAGTIKFWLIDSFVTPAFRASIQTLAQHYAFEYEFVHIRWPVWLRRQLKKHRTVWAYKVLFLDQLFPSSLDRVIYIDADQVVRSDLQELATADLKGAPWGFVPFCDSRRETEGFRFWKSGYWKGVLEGRPYHISALFVVDLRRFREMRVGDRLRRDYHMLSADPNSLANLDQDLPNHMQDDVPIHSLPQEWLWCETWCDDASKGRAKSIDLCNYPGKKETKLEQGKRIIPEWSEYDHEVAFLLDTRAAKRIKSDL